MKRAPSTQSRAGDRYAQSSDGSHYAGNAFKSARIATHQSRSQHSSDSVHFTGKVTNVLRAPSQLLAPDGCCAFCDDAAEAANDLQRSTTPSDGAHLAETPQVVGDPLAATTGNLFTFYGGEKQANREEQLEDTIDAVAPLTILSRARKTNS